MKSVWSLYHMDHMFSESLESENQKVFRIQAIFQNENVETILKRLGELNQKTNN